MDWKREAEDKLRCLEAKRSSLARTGEELRRLELDITGIRSASADSVPVSGGGNGREDAMLNNIVCREELQLARKSVKYWVHTVDSALEQLDCEERAILDRFYIHRCQGAADRLCEELGLDDVSSVYRRRAKALRHFTLAMYGVSET